MTEDRRFAQALSDALGPLYKVSLRSPDGRVDASFGVMEDSDGNGAEIPLTSGFSVILEIDPVAVRALARIARALDPDRESEPPGSFTHVDQALSGLIAMAESQIGRPIAEMNKADKQRLVRLLDDRGAFMLRRSVEAVADVLGVSRFTVYNYLDSVRQS